MQVKTSGTVPCIMVAVPASYKTDRPFVIVLEMQENTKEEGEYQQAKI